MKSDLIDRLVNTQTVRFTADWQAAHQKFSEIVYPNRPSRRDYKYLEVKLVDRTREGPNLLLAVSGEKVVGQLGLIEVEACLENSIYRSVWGVNLVVLPEFLGAGYGGLLELRALQDYKLLLGYGVSPDSMRNQSKRGAFVAAGPRMAYGAAAKSSVLNRSSLVKLASRLLELTGQLATEFIFKHTDDPAVEEDVHRIVEWLLSRHFVRGNSIHHDALFYEKRLVMPATNTKKCFTLLVLSDSYVLIDRSSVASITDFHFESLWDGIKLMGFACAVYGVNRNSAPVLVNLSRDVIIFFLTGFLVSPKRQPVYINGWDGSPIKRFYMSGLDGDVSI